MIFAYRLDDRNPDTLNPSHTEPDFLTQTGKDGSFLLSYLPYGTFRILAVRDEFKNLLYDVQTDLYGLSASDVVLTEQSPTVKGIQFKLTKEDTAVPFLSSAKFIDQTHTLIRISETVDTTHVSIDSVSVIDSVAQKAVRVFDLSFGGTPYNEAQLVTDTLKDGRLYTVQLRGFKDLSGNVMKLTSNSTTFTAGNTPDTTKPSLEIKNPNNASRDVMIDDTVHVVFSEAIRKQSFENAFTLKDSLSQKVGGVFQWYQARELFFIPNPFFAPGMAYTLTIQIDSVLDFTGNVVKDSVLTWKFTTVDERALSSISGTVTDELKSGHGKIFVIATNITKKSAKPKTTEIDSAGVFTIDRLFEGKYKLTVFRDADGNGTYTFGKPCPFEAAERFVNYPDTLRLRARWPLEGITIKLK